LLNDQTVCLVFLKKLKLMIVLINLFLLYNNMFIFVNIFLFIYFYSSYQINSFYTVEHYLDIVMTKVSTCFYKVVIYFKE